MAIGASHIVKMSPRVLSGGSSDLETNGLILTESDLIPTNQSALVFTTASDVASIFGAESDEAKAAQQYFIGVTNQQTSVKSLVLARRIKQSASAWLRSASFSGTLEELKKISDGALTLSVNSEEIKGASIDLSSANSLSDVATLIAAKFEGVTGEFNSNLSAFIFKTEATGKEASISFARVGEGGTDLAELLKLTKTAGAVVSDGVDAMTPAENMTAICQVTRNWVGFTTLYACEIEEAEGLAIWADIDEDYVFILWTNDKRATNQLTAKDSIPAQLMDRFNCTACVYSSDYLLAVFAIACGASIAWDRNQGMKVWFGKSASGLTPEITDETAANALESIRCSYYGQFATRNARFNFFNRGTLTSSHYGFIDTLYGSIVLRNAIQRSCMDGMATVNRSPYNVRGEALISAWLQDPINSALFNGIIDDSLDLSESQKTQIMQEVGEDISKQLFTKGYWFKVTMPTANVRAERGAPVVTLFYCYAGGVQSLSCETTAVI